MNERHPPHRLRSDVDIGSLRRDNTRRRAETSGRVGLRSSVEGDAGHEPIGGGECMRE